MPPPWAEKRVLSFTYVPAAVPCTVAVKVQVVLPAVIAPALRLTVVAVKAGVPEQPAPAIALTAVTVVPAGNVSVNARPACAGLPAPFVTVKVSVLVPLTP